LHLLAIIKSKNPYETRVLAMLWEQRAAASNPAVPTSFSLVLSRDGPMAPGHERFKSISDVPSHGFTTAT